MKTKTFLIIIGMVFLLGCQNALEVDDSDKDERVPELQMVDTPFPPTPFDRCTNCECGKFKDQCCDACRSIDPERWKHCRCKVNEGEPEVPVDEPEVPVDEPSQSFPPVYKWFNVDVFVGVDKKLTYSPVSIIGQPEHLYRCDEAWKEVGNEYAGFPADEGMLDNNSYAEVFNRFGAYPVDYNNNVTYSVDDKGYIYVHMSPNSPILTSNITSFTTDLVKFYYKSSVAEYTGPYVYYPRYEISLRVTVIKQL